MRMRKTDPMLQRTALQVVYCRSWEDRHPPKELEVGQTTSAERMGTLNSGQVPVTWTASQCDVGLCCSC